MCPGKRGSRAGGRTTAVGDGCPGSFVAGVGSRADVWLCGIGDGFGVTACCSREGCGAGGGALCPGWVGGGTGLTIKASSADAGLV